MNYFCSCPTSSLFFFFTSQTKHLLSSARSNARTQPPVTGRTRHTERRLLSRDTCGEVRGGNKSIDELDLPALMAPALYSCVPHLHCLQWCKVNVERHLADGCLPFMKGCEWGYFAPFLSLLVISPQGTAGGSERQKTLCIRKSSKLVFWWTPICPSTHPVGREQDCVSRPCLGL